MCTEDIQWDLKIISRVVCFHLSQEPLNVMLHGIRHEPRLAFHSEPNFRGQICGNDELSEAQVRDEFEAGVVHHNIYPVPAPAFEGVPNIIDIVDQDERLEGG